MKLLERLEQVVREIQEAGLKYSIAGGLVASLYRRVPRATADIDVAILTDDFTRAQSILRALGLMPQVFRKADLEGGPLFAIKKKNTPVLLLCGRDADARNDVVGVDLILSSMPWVKTALDRAQANRVDFGCGAIPCLTLEDLVLSKLCAVGNQSSRFMDLDDLRSIFESGNFIDWSYVKDQMKNLDFSMSQELLEFVPKKARRGMKMKGRKWKAQF